MHVYNALPSCIAGQAAGLQHRADPWDWDELLNETLRRLHELYSPGRAGSWGLLIRHAERPEITDPARALELGLTEEGRAAALALGRALAAVELVPEKVWSSPVDRCLDTAARVLSGAADLDLEQTRPRVQAELELAMATTADGEQVARQFMRRDAYELILEQLAGDAPLPGFRSVADGAGRLLAATLDHLKPGQLTLFVSHDALIMTLQRHYLARRFTREEWLPFLEGSVLFAGDAGAVELDGHALEVTP